MKEEREIGNGTKDPVNFSGTAFIFSHIVPIYIYISIYAAWDSAFAGNKIEERRGERGKEKIRGGGGDRGRLAS